MTKVEDAPGMLRVRLREKHDHGLPTALVVAEHAERAAFTRQALAVKLRELDVVATECDRLIAEASRLAHECRDLAVNCERFDADLDWAINGGLRHAR